MAGEGLAGALTAVLGGQGPRVQGCDSEPPGEPLAPVRLRRNVCYVVLAVFLNEQDEALLIQEAKRECRGSWYLPAGRMEPGESIVAALQREVKEEAGLLCEPLTLLSVEERGPAWVRFVFLARSTGGTLKTAQEADEESLQAAWYPRTSLPAPLRAHDILRLLELAAQYNQQARHPPLLPQELPCTLLCQRLVATFATAQAVWVLVGTAGMPHLPVTACGFSPMEQRGGMKTAILRLLQECLALPDLAVEAKGLLGLQHLGSDQTDGVCLDVLVSVAFRDPGRQTEPPKVRGEKFSWWKVEEEDLQRQLSQRLRDSSVVPITR
ncbi:8-oxo-dGDP phosphatase NUDT18 [Sorex fumeus]|uniref:8-oxo-dGDP phosphatase NUDT18 n=1 Tax=Sorex fumeus TaxID=62283 RepID=UPI0024AE4483|nr:8-oxo-dGDP phosphatase NUDT18 [Sorex fumeus]